VVGGTTPRIVFTSIFLLNRILPRPPHSLSPSFSFCIFRVGQECPIYPKSLWWAMPTLHYSYTFLETGLDREIFPWSARLHFYITLCLPF
jgi:hypothetical protein